MDNNIYEVSRDDYAGFLGQLNKSMCDVEQLYEEKSSTITVKSKKTGKILCTRIIYEEEPEQYYVYNMPEKEERVPPKPIQKITLTTQEEVQTFFNALAKLQKRK